MKKSTKELGMQIRLARVARGLLQSDVAKMVSVAPSIISGLETGKPANKPTPAFLVRLARRLGLEPLLLLELGRPEDFKLWSAAFGWKPAERKEAK